MSNRITIKIADIPVSILSDSIPIEKIDFGKIHKEFISNKEKAKMTIQLHYGQTPKLFLKGKKPITGIKGVWEFYRLDKKQVFIIKSNSKVKIFFEATYIGSNYKVFSDKPVCPASPVSSIAILNNNFSKGDVYFKCNRASFRSIPNPLWPLLSEILTISWLSENQGLLFHGCGVMDADRGYLFLGFSGHGKSTMASLWSEDSIVLHDDRIIVRKIKGKFWMFATPWCKGGKIGSAKGVLLNKIFFIRHGLNNRVYKQKPSDILFTLLHYCYTPLWIKKGGARNIETCIQLIQEIPCFVLDFLPDRRIVNYIRGLK